MCKLLIEPPPPQKKNKKEKKKGKSSEDEIHFFCIFVFSVDNATADNHATGMGIQEPLLKTREVPSQMSDNNQQY